jgi:DNA-binding NarL/FixJ family response regulator
MTPQPADIVLVVDDSPETLRMLTDVLDATGMTVTVALDGAAALKVAARLKPDVVLMDAVMPTMDGFETCRELKKLPGFEHVPVIFMTGLAEPEHSVRAFQVGGADYVTKPLDIDSMLARIGTHLANARKLKSAFTALDAAEQFLIAVDRTGDILWFTPQAYRLVEERFRAPSEDRLRLPPAVIEWLRGRVSGAPLPGGDEIAVETAGAQLRIGFAGATDRGELILRISAVATSDRTAALRARFALTRREAEVASWIAQGKSNRDVAAILSLSPRTVDKHLEVIFSKMGVENRTALAATLFSSQFV